MLTLAPPPTDPRCRPNATGRCAPHCALLCTDFGFAAAYAAHAGELTGFCVKALADHGLAEEITQEVFVRAWRNCARFDATLTTGAVPAVAPLRTWLFAIARNAVIDAVRIRNRRPALHRDVGWEISQPDPRDTFASFDTVDQVRDGMAHLSPVHREVLIAIYIDGLTYDQAAARIDVPTGTVKSRVYYALRALRSQLDRATAHAA